MDDNLFAEISGFKRTLDARQALVTHNPPLAAVAQYRTTQTPAHSLQTTPTTLEQYRYPLLPEGPFCFDGGTIYVTISAAAICGCIIGGGGTSSQLTSLTLNGVYTATGTPGAFLWTVTGIGSWTRQNYSDETCTTPGGTDSGDFEMTVLCADGVYTVSIVSAAGGFTLAADCSSGVDFASFAFSVSETP